MLTLRSTRTGPVALPPPRLLCPRLLIPVFLVLFSPQLSQQRFPRLIIHQFHLTTACSPRRDLPPPLPRILRSHNPRIRWTYAPCTPSSSHSPLFQFLLWPGSRCAPIQQVDSPRRHRRALGSFINKDLPSLYMADRIGRGYRNPAANHG